MVKLKTIINLICKGMKKNDCSMLLCLWSKVKRWLFLMKLIAFFFLVGLLQVNAEALGQREMVTFPSDVMVLKNVLGEIQKQLKYDIFYSDEELDVNREVILSSKKMILETALKEVLNGKYDFELIDKTIVIRPLLQQENADYVIKGIHYPV